jgi:hypothetical protein
VLNKKGPESFYELEVIKMKEIDKQLASSARWERRFNEPDKVLLKKSND